MESFGPEEYLILSLQVQQEQPASEHAGGAGYWFYSSLWSLSLYLCRCRRNSLLVSMLVVLAIGFTRLSGLCISIPVQVQEEQPASEHAGGAGYRSHPSLWSLYLYTCAGAGGTVC
jgi:hypothetical protein